MGKAAPLVPACAAAVDVDDIVEGNRKLGSIRRPGDAMNGAVLLGCQERLLMLRWIPESEHTIIAA